MKTVLICGLLIAMGLSAGCANVGVKPWQKGILARQDMQIDSSPLDNSIDQHIYFSKEASSGGQGFGGGGCGCN